MHDITGVVEVDTWLSRRCMSLMMKFYFFRQAITVSYSELMSIMDRAVQRSAYWHDDRTSYRLIAKVSI